MKGTKKSLFVSVLSLVLCVAMLLGTTYAWFTDSVQSGKNTITAGNLDVELKHYTTNAANAADVKDATDLFPITKWEPGVIAYENFVVSNEGDLALKYALNLNIYDKNTFNGHNLSEVIKVAVIEGGFTGDRAAAQGKQFQTLADFQKTGKLAAKGTTFTENETTVQASETYGVVLYWEPTDHDNDYNVNNYTGEIPTSDHKPLFVEFGINLVATQYTVEADSFDNQYDKLAEFPVVAEAKVEAGKATKLTAYDDNNLLAASAVIPADANALSGASKVIMTVDETEQPAGIIIQNNENTVNLDVKFFSVAENGAKTQITDFGTTLVSVDLSSQIPNGAALTNVYHKHGNGDPAPMTQVGAANLVTDGTFFYDINTKMLTIGSTKFSPFTIVYTMSEVKVVETGKLMTLAEFRDSVNNGDSYADKTVEMIRDVDMTGKDWVPITLDSNQVITIEGNGHTINNLTVSNYLNAGSGSGDIGSGDAASYYAGFIGQNSGTLTINNISFNNAYVDMAVPSTSEGSSILAVVVGNNYGTVVLNDVNVYSSVTKGYTKVGILHGYSQDGSFTVNHCAVENCKIILEKDGIGTTPLFSGIVAGFDYDCNVKVNGVKLVNNSFEFDGSVDQSLYSNISTTSSGLIRANLSDGKLYGIYAPIYANGNGTVEPSPSISYTINGYSYNLAGAIAAAAEGDTIICGADVTLNGTNVIAKGITLDLNGHKLSVSGASVLGVVKGASEIAVEVGTVSFDPTSYLTRSDVNVINNNDGTWTVKSFDSFDDAVEAGYYFTNYATIGTGSKFFKTAQEAVDAEMTTIRVLTDVTDSSLTSFTGTKQVAYNIYLNGNKYENATISVPYKIVVKDSSEYEAVKNSDGTWTIQAKSTD